MKKLFLLLSIFSHTILLYSQSEFINDSPFGVKADIAYSKNNNFNGFGWDVAFSLFSRFDFGVEFLHASFDPKFNVESSATLIYGAFNAKDEKKSFKIILGYSMGSITGANSYLSDFKSSGPLVGVFFSPKIYENESIILIPSLGFTLGFLSVTSNTSYISKDIVDTRSIGLEFNIVPKINKEFYFILAPSISKDLINSDNSLIFGINLGLLFSVPEK